MSTCRLVPAVRRVRYRCAAVMSSPPRPEVTLSGHDGKVCVHWECSAFLRDASEHVADPGCFPVPFSVAALRVFAEYADCAAVQQSIVPDDGDEAFARIIEERLERANPELLFEVLRVANYLECDGLLALACRVTARIFSRLHTMPGILSSVVGLEFKPCAQAVDEPVLTLPSADGLSLKVLDDQHSIHDEDALDLCLLECDAATLRVFKRFSPAWCLRARAVLCDARWQARLTSLDLEWALGGEYPLLKDKLWACCGSLCAALPNLTELTLMGSTVDLVESKSRWHLDARALRGDMSPSSPSGQDESSVALQIAAAIWTIAHNPSLTSIDLSGLVPHMGGIWPTSAVRAISDAVREGAADLRSLTLVSFDAPIQRLRIPTSEGGETPAVTRAVDSSFHFPEASMCSADVHVLCTSAGDLPHIEELDLSNNNIGDDGLLAMVGEASSSRRMLLANMRCLQLNECHIGDTGIKRFARAIAEGAFSRLENICLKGNWIGDSGLGAIADAASSVEYGALSNLLHLNASSNQITDAGCMRLARALRRGAFRKLTHLSFAMNQLSDAAVIDLANTANSKGCLARLEYLGLGANRISDEGAIALANAIAESAGLSQLRGLWLADNTQIHDAGATALAAAFKANGGSLRELYLHGLGVDHAGSDALISALPHIPELRRCVLGHVSSESLQRIKEILHCMRDKHKREDIVVCSWARNRENSPCKMPRRSSGRPLNLPVEQWRRHPQPHLDAEMVGA